MPSKWTCALNLVISNNHRQKPPNCRWPKIHYSCPWYLPVGLSFIFFFLFLKIMKQTSRLGPEHADKSESVPAHKGQWWFLICLFEGDAIISIWINPSHTSYKICVRCMWTHAYFAGSNRLMVMVSRPPASSLLAGMETALSCLPMIIKTVFATKSGLENFGIFLTSNRLLCWLQC